MTSEKKLKIARCLHISDLHLSGAGSYDEDRLASSLCASIPEFVQRFGKIDLIFFTGDLAKTGSEKEYNKATAFFNKLLDVCNVEKDQLFVIPGNHDVNRDECLGLSRDFQSRIVVDKLFSGKPVTHIEKPQQNFKKWYDTFFGGKKAFSTDSTIQKNANISANGINISVTEINSAAFSQDQHDNGRLIVGQRCLEQHIKGLSADSSAIKIAMMHHPLSWLSDVERQAVTLLIRENFDLFLHGHLHQPDFSYSKDYKNDLVTLAAGATYQGSEWPNKSNIIEVHEDKIRIIPLNYCSNPKDIWVLDTAVFPDSHDYTAIFPIKNLENGGSVRDNSKNFQNLVSENFEKSFLESNIAANGQFFVTPTSQILYVEPRIGRKPQSEIFDGDEPEFVPVADIVTDVHSYLIQTRPENGGTALLMRLQHDIQRAGQRAITINGSNFPNYRKKILENLDISESHASRSVDVLIDNFDTEKNQKLISELGRIPQIRRVVCVIVSRGISNSKIPLEAESLPFQPHVVHLWALGRSEVRALGEMFFDSGDVQYVALATSKVYDDLLALRIPLTPANVIMYFRILHREVNFRPINRVDILDRFINESLRKPSDSYSGDFNYKNKIDLTAAFALRLFEKKNEIFFDKDWFDFCHHYKLETLLEFSAREILDELVDSKIISRHGDVIFFRYSFFFSFFLGKALSENSTALAHFLMNKNYQSVRDVLDVVSSFRPNDPSLIEAVSDDLRNCIETFSESFVKIEFDPLIDAVWPSNEKEDAHLWTPVTNAISSGPAKGEEIDRLKSSYLAEARTEDQAVRIRKFAQLEYSLFSAHTTLIDLVKNCNDVGRDRKVEAYDLLLQAEMAAFQVGTMFASILAGSRIYRWGGVAFVNFNQAAADFDPKSREAVTNVVVALAESVASKSKSEVGIPKLSGLFSSRASKNERLGYQDVLNFSHIIAAKGTGWFATARSVLERASPANFYLQTMLHLILDELRSDVCQNNERQRLRELVAFIRAKRSYLKKIPSDREVKLILDSMDQDARIEKLKTRPPTSQSDSAVIIDAMPQPPA